MSQFLGDCFSLIWGDCFSLGCFKLVYIYMDDFHPGMGDSFNLVWGDCVSTRYGFSLVWVTVFHPGMVWVTVFQPYMGCLCFSLE